MTTKRPAKRAKRRKPSTGTGPNAVPQRAMRRFLAAIKDQVSPTRAAVYLGKDQSTVHKWLKAGESAKGGAQRQFFEAVTRARDEGLAEIVHDFRGHAKTDYRAAEVILRRRDPDNWGDPGKRASLEHEQLLQAEALRRAKAIADIAVAKAAIVTAAVQGESRGVVLTPVDLIALLPEALQEPFTMALREHGLTLMVLRDLAAELDEGLTEDEMMDATGLGPGGEVG